MSVSFRPVKEEWGEASSQFVDRETLIGLIDEVVNRAGAGMVSENDYGEERALWIQDGKAFLDYVEHSPEFNAASIRASLNPDYALDKEGDLASVIHNIRSLAPAWRKLIGSDGELRFYLD